MVETIDDSETFSIALTADGEPEPSAFPWMLIAALAAGVYLLTRKG